MNQGNNQADDSSNATGTEPSGISSILGIGEMFASISRNKAELTGHSASITRSVREDSSARDKQKIKLQATRSIREKFDVPYHFASALLGESETTDGTTKTDHVHQFMTTSAKATEFKRQCFEYDMGNIILVPMLAKLMLLIRPIVGILQSVAIFWTITHRSLWKSANIGQAIVFCMIILDLRQRIQNGSYLLRGIHVQVSCDRRLMRSLMSLSLSSKVV